MKKSPKAYKTPRTGRFIAKLEQKSDLGRDVYRFIVSDSQINRNGWRADTAGIDFTTNYFPGNPIVLKNHDDDEYPIGRTVNIFVEGDRLIADIEFHEEDEDSRITKKLIDLGYLKCASVRLAPLQFGDPEPLPDGHKLKKYRDYAEVITKADLEDISIVTIPGNAGTALQEKLSAALTKGELTEQEVEQFKASISKQRASRAAYIASLRRTKTANNSQPHVRTKDTMDDIQKLSAKIGELEANAKASDENVRTLTASLDKTTAEREDFKAKLAAIEGEKTALTDKVATLQASLEANAKKLIEAEVDAFIASNSTKITPGEIDKLRKDLVHLSANADTIKDADGKSYYEAKCAEIKARTNFKASLSGSINPAGGEQQLSLKPEEIDTNNRDHRAALDAKAKELTADGKMSYAAALNKVMTEGI